MRLNEVTVRLQELCHDGYSLNKVRIRIWNREFDLEDIVLLLESENAMYTTEVKLTEKEEA